MVGASVSLVPANPNVGSWYWLQRKVDGEVRHAAWFWCDECRVWEAEPELRIPPDEAAEQGWSILAATGPPSLSGAADSTGSDPPAG